MRVVNSCTRSCKVLLPTSSFGGHEGLSLLTFTRFSGVETARLLLRSRLRRQSRSSPVDHSRFRRRPRFAFQRSLPLRFWYQLADLPCCLRNFIYFCNDVCRSALQIAHARDAHGSEGMSQDFSLFCSLSCCWPPFWPQSLVMQLT